MRFPIEECRSPEQVAGILPWVEQAVREIYAADAVPASGATAREFLLQSLGQPDSLVLLARETSSNKPAAFLFLTSREDRFLGVSAPFLYFLYTHPGFRRLGVARELLLQAEQWLKKQGSRTLVAPATHNDDAIISMGERRGYLREREWMVKEL